MGYFGLGQMTGVKYDESHDGAWWGEWWEKKKRQYPPEVQEMEIPTLEPRDSSKAEKQEGPEDVPRVSWGLAGSKPRSYEKGFDGGTADGDGLRYYVRSVEPVTDGFGTLTKSMKPGEYRGKRLRMSALLQTDGVDGWAGMWLRVDGSDGKVLSFDNMGTRPLRGDTPEEKYEIVLDVPEDSANIQYGLLLGGSGAAWIGDLKFETVGTDVATTGIK